MTEKQRLKYNRMRNALIVIYREYMTPDQIHREADKNRIDYDEELRMSYENIQQTARDAVRNVQAIPPSDKEWLKDRT